jgi:hypothetical protein
MRKTLALLNMLSCFPKVDQYVLLKKIYSLEQMNFTIGNILQGLIGAFLMYTAIRALIYHSSILKTAGKIISGIMIVAGAYMMYQSYKSITTPEFYFGAGRRKY